jgi:hypothetical protein
MLPFGNVSAIFRLVFSVYCVIKQGSRVRGKDRWMMDDRPSAAGVLRMYGKKGGGDPASSAGQAQAPVIDYPIIIIEICLILAYKIR